jgi:chromosomal replication initiation ATPase DnaA
MVAKEFNVKQEEAILKANRGRGQTNIPRLVAMYLCQNIGRYRLTVIADLFGLARYATVSTNISKLKILMEENKV